MVVSGMPEGHFPVRQVGGLPVITLPAEIDIANAGELRAALLAAAKRGDASVVVDMSGTAFCDSTGLNVLVRAHKWALVEGGALRVVVAEPTLIRIFTVIGADQMIPVFASLDEAVSAPPGTLVGQGVSGPSA